jgi:chromosome segregation ATPase
VAHHADEAEQARAELGPEKERFAKIELKVLESAREAGLLLAKNAALQAEKALSARDLEAVAAELAQERSETARLRETSNAWTFEKAKLSTDVEQLQREVVRLSAPAGAAQGGIQALTEQHTAAMESVEKTTQEREQIRAQNAKLVQRLRATESQYGVLKNEYADLKIALEQAYRDALPGDFTAFSHEAEIADLRSQLQAARLEAVQKAAECHDVRQMVMEVERQRAEALAGNSPALPDAKHPLRTQAKPSPGAALGPRRGILKPRN